MERKDIDNLSARDLLLFTMKEVFHLIAGDTCNEEELVARTRGHCAHASESVVSRVYAEKIFEGGAMTVIYYYDTSQEPQTFRETDLNAHAMFVINDGHGKWYAGSPANYLSGASHPEVQLCEATTLAELLEAVTTQTGGIWPQIEYVEGALGNKPYIDEAQNKLVLHTAARSVNREIGADRTTVAPTFIEIP